MTRHDPQGFEDFTTPLRIATGQRKGIPVFIEATSKEKHVPPRLAASGVADPEAIALLPDHGADLHAMEDKGNTSLYPEIAFNGNPSVIIPLPILVPILDK